MSTTCLIPTYNETTRLPHVLKQLIQIPNLTKIIVIDDGSTDSTNQLISVFPSITFLHHRQNQGKSAAIKTGLTRVKTANILLFDGDIDFVDPREVTRSIKFFETHKSVDMLVYRTVRDHWLQKLVRADFVLSGERILRTHDLRQILHSGPKRFQLEVAINHYILQHHKSTAWIPFNGLGPRKAAKYGISGIISDWHMYYELLSYRGILSYFSDLIHFHATQI